MLRFTESLYRLMNAISPRCIYTVQFLYHVGRLRPAEWKWGQFKDSSARVVTVFLLNKEV